MLASETLALGQELRRVGPVFRADAPKHLAGERAEQGSVPPPSAAPCLVMVHTLRETHSSDRSMHVLLNVHASRGGGDRRALSSVAKKSRTSSLAAAYASHWAERNGGPDVLVGMRVNVPATHPNKYGYATKGTILTTTR